MGSGLHTGGVTNETFVYPADAAASSAFSCVTQYDPVHAMCHLSTNPVIWKQPAVVSTFLSSETLLRLAQLTEREKVNLQQNEFTGKEVLQDISPWLLVCKNFTGCLLVSLAELHGKKSHKLWDLVSVLQILCVAVEMERLHTKALQGVCPIQ